MSKFKAIKTRLLICWMFLHLLLVFSINFTETYASYLDYKGEESNLVKVVPSPVFKILSNRSTHAYGYYTGANTCYGFFGINARSNGFLIGECDGKKLTPKFNSLEAALRFTSLTSAITDELLKNSTQEESLSTKVDSTYKAYNELILKNISVKLYNEYHCKSNSILMSYNLIDFPTLREYRKKKGGEYKLHNLKSVRFTK